MNIEMLPWRLRKISTKSTKTENKLEMNTNIYQKKKKQHVILKQTKIKVKKQTEDLYKKC